MKLAETLNKRRFTVLWSGGKDSTAALLWVLNHVKHDNWNILYVEITGNTHPLCTEYVLKTAEKLGVSSKLKVVKTRDFYELMDRWGPPLVASFRWCLTHLKGEAFKHAYYFTVTGMKRADSRVRGKLSVVSVSKVTGQLMFSPILDWTKSQVLKYIESCGIELNPCYKLYGHSGNCMFCPYADKRHILLTMSDPAWRNKILPILQKHREQMMKGKMGKLVYKKWTEGVLQTTISSFMRH